MINMLSAVIDENMEFDISEDIEKNMMLASSGIQPVIIEVKNKK
jgi:hypothetical protein